MRTLLRSIATLAIVATVFTLAPRSAWATLEIEGERLGLESPRLVMFELKFGPYKPNIDDEFSGSTGPYRDIFGDDSFLMSAVQIEVEFFQDFGTLAAGGGFGFGTTSGKSQSYDGSTSSESTSLYLMPFNLSLSYHLDIFAVRWNVPLVPYVRAGIDYVVWWTTDGLGDVSDWAATDTSSVRPGRGGVWGWHVSAGLKFLLDVLAPGMAHTFDQEVGVNNSYIFAEFVHLVADDFGSGDSLRVGDSTFLFGLAFEF